MTRGEAILEVIRHARKEKTSRTANARIARAFCVLGLARDELLTAGSYLDLWGAEGKPYMAGSITLDEAWAKWGTK